MKNEHIFTGRVKALVENMKETLDRLNMVQNIEDFQYAKNILRSMMKDYLRFQIYVCKLKNLNGAGEVIPRRNSNNRLRSLHLSQQHAFTMRIPTRKNWAALNKDSKRMGKGFAICLS